MYNKSDINQKSLKIIITNAKEKALLLTTLIQSVKFLLNLAMTFSFASIKLLAILVIFYQSAHWNNSNYFPLLVTIYLYSIKTKIDAITLFNYLCLSILYTMLLNRLRSLILSSAAFIKQQVTNCKLIGM